jgi:hypothetical protein
MSFTLNTLWPYYFHYANFWPSAQNRLGLQYMFIEWIKQILPTGSAKEKSHAGNIAPLTWQPSRPSIASTISWWEFERAGLGPGRILNKCPILILKINQGSNTWGWDFTVNQRPRVQKIRRIGMWLSLDWKWVCSRSEIWWSVGEELNPFLEREDTVKLLQILLDQVAKIFKIHVQLSLSTG